MWWHGVAAARRALRRRGLPAELAAAACRAAGYARDYRTMLMRDSNHRGTVWLLRHYPHADLRHARPLLFGHA